MYDLMEFQQNRFWWKPGRYAVNFAIKSPNGATLVPSQCHFTLLKADVDALRSNVDQIKVDWENMTMAGAEGYVRRDVFWTWREPTLTPLR